MDKVWIIVDDCPSEFGEKSIIKICKTEAGADQYLIDAKAAQPYENQYLIKEEWDVTE